MIYSDSREAIMNSKGNIIISASAGAGKTTLLTNKIIKEVEENKSHYKIAAITFTHKASDEIREKLKGKGKDNYLGTNDGFVEQEIIRPFLNDAYGSSFNNDFIVTYTKNKFDTYQKGIEILKSKSILGTYNNSKRNFKFELALNILKKSKVANQYIKARYSRIYIDEYQDSDEDMHNLFMYIKDLGIKLFIVGDTKQSIYSWRGANPKLFNDIYANENTFEKYELTENFRCPISIQNYANIIQYRNADKYQKDVVTCDVIGTKDDELGQVNIDDEIVSLVRSNKEAIELQEMYKYMGYDFTYIPRTPLDDLGTNNKNILIELAKYTKNKMYTHYNFVNNIPGEFNKSEILEIKDIIFRLKGFINEEIIEKILIDLFAYLTLEFFEDIEIKYFCQSVLDSKYENSFNGKELKHKIMTVHAAKGLEFKQVIIFAKNFNLNRNDDEVHYVATTRAKNKLVIKIDDECYLRCIEKICKSNSIELKDIIQIV